MTNWTDTKLPKFIIGVSADDRTFIVHLHHPRFVGEMVDALTELRRFLILHHPRFVGEMVEGEDGTEEMRPTFIDSIDSMDATTLVRLMREAGDFYHEEIEKE